MRAKEAVFRVGLGGGDRYIGTDEYIQRIWALAIYTSIPSSAPCALRLASRNQLLRTRTIRGAACVVRLNLVLHLSHVRLRNDRPDLVCAESCVRFIWFFVSLLRRATSISGYPSSTRRAERANSLRSYTRIHSPFTTASVVAPRNLVSHYFQKQHIILSLSHSNLWKWK